MYEAKVLADSLSPDNVRLTTLQVTYPHAVHKDIMTHRMLSRNFQSFRAYPPEKVIENIKADPFIPEVFGKRVKGMGQRNEPLNEDETIDQKYARDLWKTQIVRSIELAEQYLKMDIAKQQINFILQDYTWITGIITATEWENFWALRADPTDPNALPRPEVQKIAKMMKSVYEESTPEPLELGQWHLPLIDPEELFDFDPFYTNEIERLKKVSTGRCARVSYLTHDGKRDYEADIRLADQLRQNGHMSPFEHVARPMESDDNCVVSDPNPTQLANTWGGNFRGWFQYRKEIPGEENYARLKEMDLVNA